MYRETKRSSFGRRICGRTVDERILVSNKITRAGVHRRDEHRVWRGMESSSYATANSHEHTSTRTWATDRRYLHKSGCARDALSGEPVTCGRGKGAAWKKTPDKIRQVLYKMYNLTVCTPLPKKKEKKSRQHWTAVGIYNKKNDETAEMHLYRKISSLHCSTFSEHTIDNLVNKLWKERNWSAEKRRRTHVREVLYKCQTRVLINKILLLIIAHFIMFILYD